MMNEAELSQLVPIGALRTLAMIVSCDDCPYNTQCNFEIFGNTKGERACLGADKIMAYAIAHPTEQGK